MNSERYVVYGLHSGDEVIRYVGMTTVKLSRRLYEHRRMAKLGQVNRPVYRWMQKYGPENVQAVVLEQLDGPEGLAELEIAWVAKLRETNDLLNLTDGGELFLGYVSTPEHKAALSRALRGRPNTPEQNTKIAKASLGNQRWKLRRSKECLASRLKRQAAEWYAENGYNPHQYAGHKSNHVNAGRPNRGKCLFCRDGIGMNPFDPDLHKEPYADAA